MKYIFLFVFLWLVTSEIIQAKPMEWRGKDDVSHISLQDSSVTVSFLHKDLKGLCTIKLYNPEGKLIAQDVVNAVRHQVYIRAKGLKRGVYTIEVVNGGKSYWQKVEVSK